MFFSKLTVQAFYSGNRYKDIDLAKIEALLNYRNQIMNEGFFTYIDIDTIQRDLSKIEKGTLLYNDVNIIQKLRRFSPDFSYPTCLKIKSIEEVIYKGVSAELCLIIDWKAFSLNRTVTEEFFCKVEVIRLYGDLYISNISIIE